LIYQELIFQEFRHQAKWYPRDVGSGWPARHQLEVETASLVFALAREMEAHNAAVAAEFGLTGPQARLVVQLAEPVPMGQLAERLDCDPSNVTGLVDRLQARGLLERRVNEADRRVKHLTLTPAGQRLRSELEARLFAGRPLLARLSRGDQRTLRDLLRRALGSPGDESRPG
jgi:DNA-binding MarR family transcriptional regulator